MRELENFIERSVILSRGPVLRAPVAELRADPKETGGGTLAEMEREYIVRALRKSGGVISAAASRLGVPRTTLNALMRKLGISREEGTALPMRSEGQGVLRLRRIAVCAASLHSERRDQENHNVFFIRSLYPSSS